MKKYRVSYIAEANRCSIIVLEVKATDPDAAKLSAEAKLREFEICHNGVLNCVEVV
jgi:hypothetical protein